MPKRLGTARPSARAPFTNSLAAFLRPIAWTRPLSSWAIVSGALDGSVEVVVVPLVVVVSVVPVVVVSVGSPEPVGGEDDVPSCCFSPTARPVSVFCVRAALGRNFFTLFAPISLCATTVAICGAAQFGELDPAATAARTAATAQAAASVAMR